MFFVSVSLFFASVVHQNVRLSSGVGFSFDRDEWRRHFKHTAFGAALIATHEISLHKSKLHAPESNNGSMEHQQVTLAPLLEVKGTEIARRARVQCRL